MYTNVRNKLRVLQRERPPLFQAKYLNKQTLLLVKRMIFQRAIDTETESVLGFYSSAVGDCVFFRLAGVRLKSYWLTSLKGSMHRKWKGKGSASLIENVVGPLYNKDFTEWED